MTNINNRSRVIVAVSSLSLVATFFVPFWRIDLFAPQYPEGLTMKIWLNTLKGDIDIINGLNHYIGMRHISVEMFPEFSFLTYIVIFYILLGLLVAYSGKMTILFWYLVFTAFGGVFSMYDFYRWGYEYGHNLDPAAAIKVPGLSYQPPMIGHKRLLNFDAYSQPDVGGWIIIIAASSMAFVWLYEWYRHHKINKATVTLPLVLFTILIQQTSCTVSPEPIQYGTDNCAACKMQIMDPKFGSEFITKKGKIYKFDDLGCMIRYLKTSTIHQADIQQMLAINYLNPKELIDVISATFVMNESILSPMNYHTAVYSNKEAAKNSGYFSGNNIFEWKTIYDKIE